MRRFIILAASFLLFPIFSHAQGKGAAGGAARPAPAGSASMRVVPAGVARPAAATHVVVRGVPVHSHPVGTPLRRTNSPRSSFQDQDVNTDFYPVPGLGFDVTHVAATRGPGAVGAGRHSRGGVAAFFPIFDGGYFVTPQTAVEEEPAETAPQAYNGPQDYDSYDSRPRARYRDQPEMAPPAVNPSAPVRDSEQYVFVRRDGTIIFAVAYTWEKGSLRYVTNEGLRRSVAVDLLDLDATKQFNEQRGLSFRLPV
jgi:hypothetical protein